MSRKGPFAQIMALVFAGALLALAILFNPSPADDAAAGGGGGGGFSFAVTYVPAELGNVSELTELVGDVSSLGHSILAFERPGRVTRIDAEIGEIVPKGMVMAELDSELLQDELEMAESAALAADEEAALAEREAERAARLGRESSESRRDQTESDSRIKKHRAVEEHARARRLKVLVDKGRLRAPFSALVRERRISEGSYVTAGQEAFEVFDLSRRIVYLEMPATLAADIQEGAPVVITNDDDPRLRIETQLDRVVRAADPRTRTFRGVIGLDVEDKEGRLSPGMFVRVSMERRRVEGEIVIPADALVESRRGAVIVVADDPPDEGSPADRAVARFVPVRILARTAESVAVAPHIPGSLTPGARVVVTGATNVFPSAPLTLREHVLASAVNGGPR